MFEIPDDGLIWDEDFPFDDGSVDQEQISGSRLEDSKLSKSKVGSDLSNAGNPNPTEPDATSSPKQLRSPMRLHGCVKTKSHHSDERDAKNTSKSVDEMVSKRCKRKFPGPAGILPPPTPPALQGNKSREPTNVNSLGGNSSPLVVNDEVCNLPLSQTPSEDVFTSPLWKMVLDDLGPEAQTVLTKFAIKSMLVKAGRKMLHKGKIPLIVGVIESLELQGPDASFVIRDTTGKMNGALHRDLVKDPGSAIQAGCVLVLRQVSVISPSSRTHYLNVTSGNVVLIYSASKDAGVSKRTFSSPQNSAADTKLCSNEGTDIPCLKEIIRESEQELSASMRNFHHNFRKSLSPADSSRSSPFPLTPNVSRSIRQPLPYRFKSPDMNVNMRSPMQPLRPLFSSARNPLVAPRTSVKGTSAFNNNAQVRQPSLTSRSYPSERFSFGQSTSSESLHPKAGEAQKFHQPVAMRTPPCATSLPAPGYGVSGAKAVRNLPVTSSTQHQANSSSGTTIKSHDLVGAAVNSESSISLTIDHGFDDDFPEDDDDNLILRLCDETLNPQQSGNTPQVRSDNNLKQIHDQPQDNIKQQNERLNSDPEKHCALETTNLGEANEESISAFSERNICDKDNQVSVSSMVNMKYTPEQHKKFTFKRALPSSDSPQLALPVKRPMNENQTPNLTWTKKPNDENDRMIGNRLIPSSPCVQNNKNVPSGMGLECSNIASYQTNPILPQNTEIVHDLGKSPHHISDGRNTCNTSDKPSCRDPNIELGKHKILVPTADQAQQLGNDLQQWDDDLNDDFLISQLSEDF